jgi:uncharacterized protein
MRFEWDENKNRANRIKHRINFESAILVFDDPHAISRMDRVEGDEERWQTIGMAGGIVILLVVHTHRSYASEDVIRIISARKATRLERRIYEEEDKDF